MDLSPNDIRNYEFPHQMRGYDRAEVDNFREHIATALEALKQENLKFSIEIDSLKTQLAGLRQFEDTIKSAAIDARRNADMTIANAKQEAELLLSQANTEVQQIVGSRAQKVTEIEEQITTLELTKKSYLNKLRSLIKSHLHVLEEVAGVEEASEAKSSLEVTESTEVTCKKFETIASKPQEAEPGQTQPSPADTADVTVDQEEQPGEALDPELAVALENYQYKDQPTAIQQKPSPPKVDYVPAPGQLVETTARAEDVPLGFISKAVRKPASEITEKIPSPTENQLGSAEHSPLKVSPTVVRPKSKSSIGPENLAEELDRVAAKFEEEMDKADKT